VAPIPYLIQVRGSYQLLDASTPDLTIYLQMVPPWVEDSGFVVPQEVVIYAPGGTIPVSTYYIVMEPGAGAVFNARIVQDSNGAVLINRTLAYNDPGYGVPLTMRYALAMLESSNLLGEFYYFNGAPVTGTLRVELTSDWLLAAYPGLLLGTLPGTIDYPVAPATAQGIEDATKADPLVVTITGHGYLDGDMVDFAAAGGMVELNGRRLMIANKAANTFNLRAEPVAITGATKRTTCIVTAPGHTFTAGDTVYIDRVLGMTDLNGHEFTVANPVGNTFELSGINSTAYGTYTSGGEVRGLVDSTAYTAYPSFAISGATKAATCVVTAVGHTFVAGQSVDISGVVGMTELNGNTYTVGTVVGDTFELAGVNSTGYGTYTSDGTARLTTDGTARWSSMLGRRMIATPITCNMSLRDASGTVLWERPGVAITEDFPLANRCTISDQIVALNQ
jgi:hypothetical protein